MALFLNYSVSLDSDLLPGHTNTIKLVPNLLIPVKHLRKHNPLQFELLTEIDHGTGCQRSRGSGLVRTVSQGTYRAYNTIKDNSLPDILVIHHRGLATYLESVGLLPGTLVYLGSPWVGTEDQRPSCQHYM